MSNIRKQLLGFFLQEASEHLATLEDGLLRLEKDPNDRSMLEELFRSAHTIKGSAALVKLNTTSALAHRLEDTFEAIRDGLISPSRELVDAMIFAMDQIKDQVHRASNGEDESDDALEAVERSLKLAEEGDAAQHSTIAEVIAETPFESAVTEADDSARIPVIASVEAVDEPEDTSQAVSTYSEQQAVPVEKQRPADRPPTVPLRPDTAHHLASGGVIKISSDKLDGMMNVLGEITITKNHLMDQLTVVDRLRSEIDFAGQRLLREVNNFSERYSYSVPESVKYKDPLLSEFMELEFDRYDEVNLFAKKLQEITNDVNEALRSLGNFFTRFTGDVGTLDGMIAEMKERISEARMIQAGNLFQRFTRAVRDLSRQAGKPVRLLVAGGDTPLDRVVYDGLFEPILHIIRNAVAHGLESEDERKRIGKPPVGTIRMSARREGNTAVIDIRDDGKGIQFNRIRKRAIDQGLLDPNEEVRPKDLLKFIFMHGFSTADATDHTSGRGIGLDVVKDRLAALNGTLSILTKKERGTIFRMRLPLSLVIINVVHFRVGKQSFVIPSNLVVEIAELTGTDLRHDNTVQIRDVAMPSVDLSTVFRMQSDSAQPSRFAIVTRVSGTKVALRVDEILSQEDTIIKPFGSFLRELHYYSGTSISGSGMLRLVINPSWIVEGGEKHDDEVLTGAMDESRKPSVLVVDDSLSVRKFASTLLEAHDYEVRAASNGLQALDILDEYGADLILTDLEMPVMHGYELLGELRRRGLLDTIPVVVLTSRGSEQHRIKAFDLGATDYLIKPFEEESLITTVQRHIKDHQTV